LTAPEQYRASPLQGAVPHAVPIIAGNGPLTAARASEATPYGTRQGTKGSSAR